MEGGAPSVKMRIARAPAKVGVSGCSSRRKEALINKFQGSRRTLIRALRRLLPDVGGDFVNSPGLTERGMQKRVVATCAL